MERQRRPSVGESSSDSSPASADAPPTLTRAEVGMSAAPSTVTWPLSVRARFADAAASSLISTPAAPTAGTLTSAMAPSASTYAVRRIIGFISEPWASAI